MKCIPVCKDEMHHEFIENCYSPTSIEIRIKLKSRIRPFYFVPQDLCTIAQSHFYPFPGLQPKS